MIKMDANFKEINSFIGSIPKQMNTAASKAINDTLFDLLSQYLDEMPKIFESPNMSYLRRAFQIEKSTPDKVYGSLFVKQDGLGKGTSFIDVLHHHVVGNEREIKKFEKAMMYHGHMGRDMIAAPARGAKLDRYGGLDGKFNSMLLSYFGSYTKAGFDATMTPKKKERMARRGTVKGSQSGKKYKTIRGAVYFMSGGRQGFGGNRSHLHAGIYKKSGIHGSTIEPVILFVKKRSYQKRFDFYGIAERLVDQKFANTFYAHLDRRMK